MAMRDRASEITEIKQRDPYGHGYLSYTLNTLKKEWLKTGTECHLYC
jgi:hypothetical protein